MVSDPQRNCVRHNLESLLFSSHESHTVENEYFHDNAEAGLLTCKALFFTVVVYLPPSCPPLPLSGRAAPRATGRETRLGILSSPL